jgi:hypothetical protein
MKITDDQIKALRREAERHGDLYVAMTCVLALGGIKALEGAESGTDAAALLTEERTQEWARTRCACIIAQCAKHLGIEGEP